MTDAQPIYLGTVRLLDVAYADDGTLVWMRPVREPVELLPDGRIELVDAELARIEREQRERAIRSREER